MSEVDIILPSIFDGGVNKHDRLVTSNYIGNHYNMLIDTGAGMPVWVDGEESFRSFYPKAKKTLLTFPLSGMGVGQEFAPVWRIPKFVLSDGNNKVEFTDLYLVVTKRLMGFKFIMSYTMLSNSVITIDKRKDVPTILMHFTQNEYHTRLTLHKENKKWLNTIDILVINPNTARYVSNLKMDIEFLQAVSYAGINIDKINLDDMLGDVTLLSNDEIIERILTEVPTLDTICN